MDARQCELVAVEQMALCDIFRVYHMTPVSLLNLSIAWFPVNFFLNWGINIFNEVLKPNFFKNA